MASARYRAAANYARRVLKAKATPPEPQAPCCSPSLAWKTRTAFLPWPISSRKRSGLTRSRTLLGICPPARFCCSKQIRCARRHARCGEVRYPLRGRCVLLTEPHVPDTVPSLPARATRSLGSFAPGRLGSGRYYLGHSRLRPWANACEDVSSSPRNLRAATAFSDANAPTMSSMLGTAS